MEPLFGATFEGFLEPPGASRCELQYTFHDKHMDLPLPAIVKRKRQELGWSCKGDVCAISAKCSIPALGMKLEEVCVSIDPVAGDGSRKMLLLSLVKPELGVTILRLEQGNKVLIGGDDTWDPQEPPIIRTSLKEASSPSSPKSPKRSEQQALSAASPMAPSKPSGAMPSGSARRPAPREVRVAKEEPQVNYNFPPASPPRTPSPDPERVPVGAWNVRSVDGIESSINALSGGVGRSAMGASAKPVVPSRFSRPQGNGYQNDDFDQRPDIAIGPPGSENIDERLRAAEADATQRLISAAAQGETGDITQILAASRVAPDSIASEGRHMGLTALIAAAQKGREEAISLLLERQAAVDAVDSNGWTALMHSVQEQRLGVVQQLIAAKASVNGGHPATQRAVTPLMLACAGARHELCSKLLEAGAAKEMRDEEGRRAVHYAAKQGQGAALALLLRAKAKVDEVDDEGLTPLLLASRAGRTQSVKILLANKANRDARDQDGKSAEDLATAYAHDRVLAALAEGGG